MNGIFIGIDLGGTKIKGCLVSEEGDLLKRLEAETHDDGNAVWVDNVEKLVTRLEAEAPSVAGMGLAAPGVAMKTGRAIGVMPGRLNKLEGLDWTQSLGRSLEVHVLNDAHAFAIGEAWLGAARGSRHVVALTLGTGVGGGVISDGRLLLGRQCRAGHLGHMSLDPEGPVDATGMPGSLESAIGELSLPQRSNGRFTSTVELLVAVREGDAEAAEIWKRSVRHLAAAVASFINLFDPEKVVLGGGISQAGDALLQPLRARLDEIEWRLHGRAVPVVVAELGSWAGAVGAARYAMQEKT